MRKIFLLAAVLMLGGPAATAGPPPIIWRSDKQRPEVVDGRENIVIVRDPAEKASAVFAEDTQAGRIVAKGYILTWAPKWHFQGTGRAQLPDAAMSGDNTVLAVLETAGAEQGPWQSRIVCISPGSGQVLRIIELKERRIDRIQFLPGSTAVLLYQAGQEVFEQPNRLLKVDLANGSVKAEFAAMPGEPGGWCVNADGSRAAVKLKDSQTILVYDLKNPDRAPDKIDSGFEGGAIEFTPDGESILAAGPGNIYFFNLRNIGTQSRDPLRLPGGFLPDILLAAADRPGEILAGKTNGPLYLLRDERSFMLDDSLEGFAAFAGDVITLVTLGNSTARFLDRNTLNEINKFQVKAERPSTRGNLVRVFYNPRDGVTAVDGQGNIYTRKLAGRKWNKKLLFEANK